MRSRRVGEAGGDQRPAAAAFVKTNFPYAGTLVTVSCPKGSQWKIGLSGVANPGKPPGAGLCVTTARNGGHAEGGAQAATVKAGLTPSAKP